MNPTLKTLGEDAASLGQAVAQSAENAVHSTQRALHNGVEHFTGTLDQGRSQTSAALDRFAHDSSQMAQHGMDAVREGAQQLRNRSAQARESTAHYIQHDPIKSVLIAAALGATIMGLITLVGRSGSGR